MKRLLPVTRLARQWHRRPWAASDLPGLLNATLVVDHVERVGNRRILGLSYHRDDCRSIAINETLVGTPHYVPVLAHEAAHIINDIDGIHLCALDDSERERMAWFGAAILAIPAVLMQAFERGAMMPEDVAEQCLVPIQFVAVRYALVSVLRSETALATHAANVALNNWIAWLRRSVGQ